MYASIIYVYLYIIRERVTLYQYFSQHEQNIHSYCTPAASFVASIYKNQPQPVNQWKLPLCEHSRSSTLSEKGRSWKLLSVTLETIWKQEKNNPNALYYALRLVFRASFIIPWFFSRESEGRKSKFYGHRNKGGFLLFFFFFFFFC